MPFTELILLANNIYKMGGPEKDQTINVEPPTNYTNNQNQVTNEAIITN